MIHRYLLCVWWISSSIFLLFVNLTSFTQCHAKYWTITTFSWNYVKHSRLFAPIFKISCRFGIVLVWKNKKFAYFWNSWIKIHAWGHFELFPFLKIRNNLNFSKQVKTLNSVFLVRIRKTKPHMRACSHFKNKALFEVVKCFCP